MMARVNYADYKGYITMRQPTQQAIIQRVFYPELKPKMYTASNCLTF